MCLVASPLNESEAEVDLFSIAHCFCHNWYKNSIINIRKAGRFLSKRGQVQPHFHSKARDPFLERGPFLETFRVTQFSLYFQNEGVP